MGVYKKAIITDAGEALRARAVAGEASMQFSHAKTSTYVYPDGTDLTKLTDLQEIRQTVIPSNVQIANDTLISVRSLFGNEQINEAYLIQNVGVYATDGENEILFAVCQAITPDQMPAYDGVAPSSFIYNVQLTVSQAAQISLVVNTAGTATTQDVLELEQKKVNGNGGDISETVIAATEKSQAEYPVPAAGDSAKTVLGKVQKFFGDLRNWMTGVCLLGQIVNNCVTDNAKLPLSAAQGKVLMDLYNVLNTKGLKNRFSVDLGTYWDGTEKQFSLTYPEDGTYLLYVRVHVVGANKMNAGSSVVLNGKGITATYPESIPLAKDWDRWRSAVFIVPTASGTYDYSLQGSFQGSRADANYGSSVTISIFKLSSATDFA